MIKLFIQKTLAKFGYIIVKQNQWRPKQNFESLDISEDIKPKIIGNTMLYEIRLVNILLVSEYLLSSKIEGDFVECGVWKGGSVALMAHFLKIKNEIRDIHLFDCFDDICQPDSEVDGEKAIREAGGMDFAKGELKPLKGIYDNHGGAGNEIKVQSLIVNEIGYPSEHVIIHKGWFQDTLPEARDKIQKIALLRLDGDWYASTMVCLESLYEKVAIGGIVIIDDYECYEGCKRAVDEFLLKINFKPFLIKVDDECVYWIKY